jgi:O-acetylserine/cysteine efflux transporter
MSVIIAVLVFGTPITTQMVIGGVLTIIGVAIITLRTAKARDDVGTHEPLTTEPT